MARRYASIIFLAVMIEYLTKKMQLQGGGVYFGLQFERLKSATQGKAWEQVAPC